MIKRFLKEKKALNDIVTLTGAQVALRPILMVKSYFVARYLGPETFGILKSVELVSMLDKFGNLGFKQVVIRNVATSEGAGNPLEIENIKNNAYTSEILLSIILFLSGLISSLFIPNDLIAIAVILASIGLLTSKLLGVLKTELQSTRRFSSLARIIFCQGVINSALVIFTVPYYELYAVLLVPSISTLIILIIFFNRVGYFFTFKLDKSGFLDVLKLGITLSFSTLAFGFFRYVERFIIITFLGLTAVGYYGFADTIAGIFISILLGSVLKVRSVTIFKELGRRNYSVVHKIIIRETALLILLSLLFIILLSGGLIIFVPKFLPEWEEAINVTILFSLVIPLKLSSAYINFVVKSPTVNNLRLEPGLQMLSALLLLFGVLSLDYFNVLTLTTFLVVDVFVYAILHISTVIYYYYSYYKKYVLTNAN
jgi:O-antigen/teichoic acid export membrane protein